MSRQVWKRLRHSISPLLVWVAWTVSFLLVVAQGCNSGSAGRGNGGAPGSTGGAGAAGRGGGSAAGATGDSGGSGGMQDGAAGTGHAGMIGGAGSGAGATAGSGDAGDAGGVTGMGGAVAGTGGIVGTGGAGTVFQQNTCPTTPPAEGSSCDGQNAWCFYQDCAGAGRTLATCTGNNWHIETGACGMTYCTGPGATGNCPENQYCVVQSGGALLSRCETNALCNGGPVSPCGCRGDLCKASLNSVGCAWSASIASGVTEYCVTCNTDTPNCT